MTSPADSPPRIAAEALSLFLDVDGTLIELAERPDAVIVGDHVTTTLDRLSVRLDGRIALVSGRSVAQLDAIIGPAARRVVTIGSHGAETRDIGTDLAARVRPPALAEAETYLRDRFPETDGALLEVKTLGLALHYRLNPSLEDAAIAAAEAFGREHGLVVQRGKMMVELRAGGPNKGHAITALMAGPHFAGRIPLFLGDDETDEPGFAACAALGGAGVLVGPLRATAARYRLPDVTAVHAWLGTL